jgi:hypothetical protein
MPLMICTVSATSEWHHTATRCRHSFSVRLGTAIALAGHSLSASDHSVQCLAPGPQLRVTGLPWPDAHPQAPFNSLTPAPRTYPFITHSTSPIAAIARFLSAPQSSPARITGRYRYICRVACNCPMHRTFIVDRAFSPFSLDSYHPGDLLPA